MQIVHTSKFGRTGDCRWFVALLKQGMCRMDRVGWPWLVYAAVTATLGPLLLPPLLLLRRVRGLEHALHWKERLGHASLPRPAGPLLWFHAVSVGEGMLAIPIIHRCILERPAINILMTTSTVTAFSVLENFLPKSVLCQFAPFDTPSAVRHFLKHWQPQAAIFMESEIWPNLLLASAEQGVALALLNARMSLKSYERWSMPPAKELVSTLLSKFSLIAPLNTKEAVQFQVLGASPAIIHFAGNLKYACSNIRSTHLEAARADLFSQMKGRRTWLAASTHQGEEEAALKVHKHLRTTFPDVLTIIAPRHPECAPDIVKKLKKVGVSVARRSEGDQITGTTEVYLADTVGELSVIYSAVPIAFVGGSLFKGLSGHNFAEAAAARCAVLTGSHLGHFSEMLKEMQRLEALSVEQVSGEHALQVAVEKLMHDEELLSARREAAQRAASIPAADVVSRVWRVLDVLVLSKSLDKKEVLFPVTDSIDRN